MDTTRPDPGLASLADFARRIESRIVGLSARTKDGKTVLIIELAGATTEKVESLATALREHRRAHDFTTEFLIFNSKGG